MLEPEAIDRRIAATAHARTYRPWPPFFVEPEGGTIQGGGWTVVPPVSAVATAELPSTVDGPSPAWTADFIHHPRAIEVLLLALAAAFLVTYLFYERNLKPTARRHLTRLAFAAHLREDLAVATSSVWPAVWRSD